MSARLRGSPRTHRTSRLEMRCCASRSSAAPGSSARVRGEGGEALHRHGHRSVPPSAQLRTQLLLRPRVLVEQRHAAAARQALQAQAGARLDTPQQLCRAAGQP